jgi:hypothetical protein
MNLINMEVNMEEKMYRKISLVMLVVAFILSACSGILSPGSPTPEPVVETPAGVESPVGEVPQDGSVEPWEPAPGDENLNRAEVEIDSAEILTLESFPPQFQLHVTGSKGNPCNILRVAVNDPDEENHILIDVYTLYDPAALCLAVLEGLDINIPLGIYPTGEYTVVLNGELVGTIMAP